MHHGILAAGPIARYIHSTTIVNSLGWGPIFTELRNIGFARSPEIRIVDVGSRNGRGLQYLAYAVFTQLTGCDPFID